MPTKTQTQTRPCVTSQAIDLHAPPGTAPRLVRPPWHSSTPGAWIVCWTSFQCNRHICSPKCAFEAGGCPGHRPRSPNAERNMRWGRDDERLKRRRAHARSPAACRISSITLYLATTTTTVACSALWLALWRVVQGAHAYLRHQWQPPTQIGEKIPTNRRTNRRTDFSAKQVPTALDLSPRAQHTFLLVAL